MLEKTLKEILKERSILEKLIEDEEIYGSDYPNPTNEELTNLPNEELLSEFDAPSTEDYEIFKTRHYSTSTDTYLGRTLQPGTLAEEFGYIPPEKPKPTIQPKKEDYTLITIEPPTFPLGSIAEQIHQRATNMEPQKPNTSQTYRDSTKPSTTLEIPRRGRTPN